MRGKTCSSSEYKYGKTEVDWDRLYFFHINSSVAEVLVVHGIKALASGPRQLVLLGEINLGTWCSLFRQ